MKGTDYRRLKRAVIKEELFAVTGDANLAVILNQFIYWQERVEDYDRYVEEEEAIAVRHGEDVDFVKTHGWIYKKAADLIDECMMNVSDTTMRRYVNVLVDKGFLSCRNNPDHKWDKTLQYRVNIGVLIARVKSAGYDGLEGYTSIQNAGSNLQNAGSKASFEAAIPEITNIEIKEDIDKSISKKSEQDVFVDRMYALYPAKCPMRKVSLGKSFKDKNRIRTLLKMYTEEEIERVIRYEVEMKYGKSYMQNFSTFLNNFPDPCNVEDDVSHVEDVNIKKAIVIDGQIYK